MMDIEEIQSRYERLLEEERERTTVMTLANSDKQQELHTLRKQKTALLKALTTIAKPNTGIDHQDHCFRQREVARTAIEAAS